MVRVRTFVCTDVLEERQTTTNDGVCDRRGGEGTNQTRWQDYAHPLHHTHTVSCLSAPWIPSFSLYTQPFRSVPDMSCKVNEDDVEENNDDNDDVPNRTLETEDVPIFDEEPSTRGVRKTTTSTTCSRPQYDRSRRRSLATQEKVTYAETLKRGLEGDFPYLLKQVKADADGGPSASYEKRTVSLLDGAEINERYVLVRPLGAGCYGQGWEAVDKRAPVSSKRRKVFLKTFKFGNCRGKSATSSRWEKTVKFATRELRMARQGVRDGKFRHKNVVSYYDAQYLGRVKLKNEEEPRKTRFPFLVTEFVDGRDLQAYCSDWFTALWYRATYPTKTWPMNEKTKVNASREQFLDVTTNARHIFKQLMEAIAYLHAEKCFVWDIKPDNLMITRDGKHVKVMDFGMGKIVKKKSKTKSSGRTIATLTTTYESLPAHSAPELRPMGLGGVHSGSSCMPGPVDIYLCGQVLMGITCLKEHIPYMIAEKNWDLPSFAVGTGSLEVKSFEDLFRLSPKMRNRFRATKYADGPNLLDLMTKMLDSDPKKRPTATEVLAHPWLK